MRLIKPADSCKMRGSAMNRIIGIVMVRESSAVSLRSLWGSGALRAVLWYVASYPRQTQVGVR